MVCHRRRRKKKKLVSLLTYCHDDRNKAIEVRFASDLSYDYHDDDDYDDALHGYGDDTLDD